MEYIIVVKGTMEKGKRKFETGTIVTHVRNPRWRAVVIKDIFPRRTTWGLVKVCVIGKNTVRGKGFITNMPKTLLKIKA
jgi:hypothetical protein